MLVIRSKEEMAMEDHLKEQNQAKLIEENPCVADVIAAHNRYVAAMREAVAKIRKTGTAKDLAAAMRVSAIAAKVDFSDMLSVLAGLSVMDPDTKLADLPENEDYPRPH